MRRRQVYAAQAAAVRNPVQTVAAALEMPPIPAPTLAPTLAMTNPAAAQARKPGHCVKCGQHIGRGLPFHERRCQG